MYVQTKHTTSLNGWFDDALSAVNDAVKSANQVCQAINSTTGQAVQAAGGVVLPTSGANTVNTAVEYANGVCNVINPPKGLPTAGTKTEMSMPTYPTGSIAVYSKGVYRIAVPATGAAAFKEIGVTTTLPTGVISVSESEFNKGIDKWYTTWWFKTAAGVGGAGVIGTLAWAILR